MTVDETTSFEDEPAAPLVEDFVLDLEGYEGPIDALLQLARDQKVDLTKISILRLADQYLEFVRQARRLRLELAADYLVMAAWLAYLKSRLLLPEPEDGEEPSGAELAAALRLQLQRLEAIQRLGQDLMARPRLGQEVFARGAPEPLKVITSTVFQVSLYDLLKAYGANKAKEKATNLKIESSDLYSVEVALGRLSRLIGCTPGWHTLASFLPSDLRGGVVWRSAVASTFAASLVMCREGKLKIRQESPFGPIYFSGQEQGD